MTPHTHPLPDGRRAYCSDRLCRGESVPHLHLRFVVVPPATPWQGLGRAEWRDVECNLPGCDGDVDATLAARDAAR